MNCLGCRRTNPERGRKQVCSRPEMLNSPQKFNTVPFFLQRIIRCGNSFHRNFFRLHFKRLGCIRCENNSAPADESCSYILFRNFIVIGQRITLKNNLKRFKAASVVEFNKTKVFDIADCSCPTAYCDCLPFKSSCIGINAGYSLTLHKAPLSVFLRNTSVLYSCRTAFSIPNFHQKISCTGL